MSNPYNRYCVYRDKLEEEGRKFPINQFGELNLSKISKDCGNRRQWFSENADKIFGSEQKTLSQIVSDDSKRIGIEIFQEERNLSKKSTIFLEKENERLRSDLDKKLKEVKALRSEVQYLTSENQRLKASSSEIDEKKNQLLETGRSFSWP